MINDLDRNSVVTVFNHLDLINKGAVMQASRDLLLSSNKQFFTVLLINIGRWEEYQVTNLMILGYVRDIEREAQTTVQEVLAAAYRILPELGGVQEDEFYWSEKTNEYEAARNASDYDKRFIEQWGFKIDLPIAMVHYPGGNYFGWKGTQILNPEKIGQYRKSGKNGSLIQREVLAKPAAEAINEILEALANESEKQMNEQSSPVDTRILGLISAEMYNLLVTADKALDKLLQRLNKEGSELLTSVRSWPEFRSAQEAYSRMGLKLSIAASGSGLEEIAEEILKTRYMALNVLYRIADPIRTYGQISFDLWNEKIDAVKDALALEELPGVLQKAIQQTFFNSDQAMQFALSKLIELVHEQGWHKASWLDQLRGPAELHGPDVGLWGQAQNSASGTEGGDTKAPGASFYGGSEPLDDIGIVTDPMGYRQKFFCVWGGRGVLH